MKSLIPVFPKYKTDCAITAVATLTGKTYEKTLKIMLPKRKKHSTYGATIPEVLSCLRKMKFKINNIKNVNLKELKNHAILVIVVPFKGYARGWDYHAVVWDSKKKTIIDGYCIGSARKYQKMILHCFEVTLR